MIFRIKSVLALAIMLVASLQSFAQDFAMSPGSIGVCSGNWLDPGGNNNYSNNANTTQTIYSSTGKCLQISFTMFNVDVNGDTLYAYDGSNTTFPLIGKYTGTILPADIISTNGFLTFKFKSNGITVKPGWKATISCVSCSVPTSLPSAMISGTFSACSGIFQDPGGNGNYPNSQSATTIIYPATTGNNLSINFSSFNLGTGDNLKVYNGPSVSYPLMGVYSGNASPGIVTAANGPLTFVFTSDASNSGAGWDATVSCVPVNSNCGNCSGPAPVNDYCSNATDLGNLPSPAACPNALGTLKVINGTNLCATTEAMFSNHGSCSGVTMNNSTGDVWYKFNITGSILNITLTGLDTPALVLYSGNSYISLSQIGCAAGLNGQASTSFSGLAAGTYYLQVSGGSLADECNFSLVLQNNNECSGCVVQSSFTATPPPVNGAYSPGQVVNFCYTVTNFISQSGNSLHGVVPAFGNGWDASTFTPISAAASCSGAGTWSWYPNAITSTKNNFTAGPGWFYETNVGNPLNKKDNNPGNNYGDNGSCHWQFCWSMKVKDSAVCVNGKSLGVSVKTYGDGQTGALTSTACSFDVPFIFNSIIACCDSPTITTTPACAGAANGTAKATGHGVSPYTFTWKNSLGAPILSQSNVDSVSTINNLAAGNYSLMAQDNGGCVKLASFKISTDTINNPTLSTTSVTCANPGSVQLNLNGGTAPYSFSWNNGATSQNLTNISEGGYNVIVTDALNCTASAAAIVDNTIQMPVASVIASNAACGQPDGSININVSLGTAPYSFNWSSGDTTQNLTGISSGAYYLTITDAALCTLSETVNVGSVNGSSITDTVTNTTCGNNNGGIKIIVLGGTSPYSFRWNTADSVQNLQNIATGDYSITVTDANSCASSLNITVTGTSNPMLTETHVQPNCGKSDGSIQINVNGGIAPYSYIWSDNSTTTGISNATSGNYSVTVTDAGNCSASLSVLLPSCTPVTCNMQVTDSLQNVICPGSCNGGIFLTINNAQQPYQFHWADGTTTQNRQSICPGIYKVTITDANGCGDTSAFFLAMAQGAHLQLQATDAMCNGMALGSLNAIITGGHNPYAYRWSNGATTATVSNVPAGTYVVVIKDAIGCNYSGTDTVHEPDPLLLFNSSTNEYCNQANGTVMLNVNGGATPYTFKWNNNATTQNLTGLSAGTYSVTVKDVNSCSAITSVTINNINAQPVTVSPTNAKICSGSAANFTISGDNNYTWTPATGLDNSTGATVSASPSVSTTYTVTSTDQYGCVLSLTVPVNVLSAPVIVVNPAHPSTCSGGTAAINVSGAATYQWMENGVAYNTNGSSITVKPTQTMLYKIKGVDGFGCVGCDSVIVFVNPLPQVTATVNDSLVCPGNPVVLSAKTSSTGNINYRWSAAGNTVGSTQNVTASPATNTNYLVTITDANGCTAGNSVSVKVEAGPQINLAASDTSICSGAKVTLSYSGADSYSWSSSTGIISSNSSSTVASPNSTTTYILSGKDNTTGCMGSKLVVVKVHPLPGVSITASNLNACLGSDIILSATGASQYTWSASNAITTSTGSTVRLSLTEATKFTVTGVDAFGCMNEDTATIHVYSSPVAAFSASSFGGCAPWNVSFTNSSTGATSYNWIINHEPVSSDSDFAHIFEPGTYYVSLVAIGAGGCTDTFNISKPVKVLTSPHAFFTVSPDLNTQVLVANAIFNFNNLSIGANNYLWNFGDNTSSDAVATSHRYTKAGSYTVSLIATNTDGCSDTIRKSSVIVIEPENAFVPNTFTPNGDGENDVFKIYATGVRSISFTIYDRGGNEIYHTDNNVPWDGTFNGKPLNTGVYICSAVIEYLTGKKEQRQNDITLLR